MKTIQISLRALSHPISLISITLLIVNDHFLKVYTPSWLTGKLSDFAGLVFFPFLVAILLGLFLECMGMRPQSIARLSMGITLVWFTGIKTVPWINQFTALGIGKLLGSPIQIVLDPTDLIALISLWPAWNLWNVSAAYNKGFSRAIAVIAFGTAIWATMATSCPYTPHVDRVIFDKDRLYARIDYGRYGYMISSDSGYTWMELQAVPKQVEETLNQVVMFPKVVCVPDNAQICYRIVGKNQIEISNDGGRVWKVDWEIPTHREYYMDRAAYTITCGKDPDFAVFDLTIVPDHEEYTVVAAMGNEGILLKPYNGDWERHEVFNAVPTPWKANSFSEAHKVIYVETFIGLGWAILTFIFFSLLAAYTTSTNILAYKIWPASGKTWWWPMKPFVWASLFSIALIALLLIFRSGELSFLTPLLWGIPIYELIGLVMMWWRTYDLAQNPKIIQKALWVAFLSTSAIALAIWLVFLFWAFNLVSSHEVASSLAILISFLLLVFGVRRLRQLSLLASGPVE